MEVRQLLHFDILFFESGSEQVHNTQGSTTGPNFDRALVLSTQVYCDQEVLVLLWKLLEENPVFMQYVLKNCDINEVCVKLAYLLWLIDFCSLEDDRHHACPVAPSPYFRQHVAAVFLSAYGTPRATTLSATRSQKNPV